MKYLNPALRVKYGDPNKYHFSFCWKQAMSFYLAAKALPIESSPLASYYSMLNAVKALIAYKKTYVDDFVVNFSSHGLLEDKHSIGEGLETIGVQRLDFGVFTEFGKILESNFGVIWPRRTAWTLKKMLYNLAFLHRAYVTTYTTPRGRRVPELFLPVKVARRNTDSISGELKALNTSLRKNFQYIKSSKRLWYLRCSNLGISDIINANSMLIEMAAMHRFSEIVRYKPEQLARLMNSKENWLTHEFLSHALDQFIDEIAAEITGQDIMCTGVK